jgi:hypothetical protein
MIIDKFNMVNDTCTVFDSKEKEWILAYGYKASERLMKNDKRFSKPNIQKILVHKKEAYMKLYKMKVNRDAVNTISLFWIESFYSPYSCIGKKRMVKCMSKYTKKQN